MIKVATLTIPNVFATKNVPYEVMNNKQKNNNVFSGNLSCGSIVIFHH